MRSSKMHFEQIPVKIVKMIAEELPAKKKVQTADTPLKPGREKHPPIQAAEREAE